MTDDAQEPRRGSGWWLALAAVPVLCCAGPALLATIGAGSVGAVAGAVGGSALLTLAGVAAATVAVAGLLVRRRRMRR